LTYDPPGLAASDLQAYHTIAAGPPYSSASAAIPLLTNFPALENRFTIWDRSYPTFTRTRQDTLANFKDDLEERDLFWVPFIQDVQGDQGTPVWVMHLFILKGDSRATWTKDNTWANPLDPDYIPGVTAVGVTAIGTNDTVFQLSAAHTIRVGSQILDTNGISYRVTNVAGNDVTIDGAILTSPAVPTAVYYAPPGVGGTGDSPTLAIITFSSDSNDPNSVQLVTDPTP